MTKQLLTTLLLTAAFSSGASAVAPGIVQPVKSPAAVAKFNKIIRPVASRVPAADGVKLFESFEGGNYSSLTDPNSMKWLPEGWTRDSKSGQSDGSLYTWVRMGQYNYAYPAPTDGTHYMMLLPDEGQDEWLISPEIAISGTEILSFDALIDPAYFFHTGTGYQDTSTGEWIKQEIAQRFQVLVKEEDGDWKVLRDFAEELMGKSIIEITELQQTMASGLMPYEARLSDYAGKTVSIAFRYAGSGANGMFLDAVRVGLPEISASYVPDFSTLYYGTILDAAPSAAPEPIALMPAFTPLNWMNLSDYESGAKYAWIYASPDGDGTLTSDDDDLLGLAYSPVYTDGVFVAKDNWRDNPILSATAPGYVDKTFTAPGKFQAGGAAITTVGETEQKFGLLPLSPAEYGFSFAGVESDESFSTIPIFGYNDKTDKFWTDYTFKGENGEGEYSKLTGILNCFYAPTSPVVLTGGWVNAYGLISNEAEFTYSIYPLNKDFVQIDTPVATAKCKGSDALVFDAGYNYFTLPFTFDKAAVIDNSKYDAYIIKLTGFNSPEVTYFAPLQTWKPASLCFGFLEKEISHDGYTGASLSPMANVENEYGPMMGAFALNLDGYFPWLKAEKEEIDLGEGTMDELKLESFHDGSEYTVEAPSWIKASVSGRYADTKLTVVAEANPSAKRTGTITVKAPGVSKSFTVSQLTSGIEDIVSDNGAAIVAVYTTTGVEVNPSNLAPGIYIIRYSDGSVRKINVK